MAQGYENFKWHGLDNQGNKASGQLSGASALAIKSQLLNQGFSQIVVSKSSRPLFKKSLGNISSRDITLFSRQMATMMPAGIPIVQSLDIIAHGTENKSMKEMVLNIKQQVAEGVPLAEAMKKYEKHFSKLACNLVAVGEESGTLDHILKRIAIYKEKIEAIKGKIKKALYYPVAVITIALLIGAGLLIFIVPQFEALFKNFGADLPAFTRLIITASEILRAWWWLYLIGIVVGLVLFFNAYKNSKSFTYLVDRMILKLPIFGSIFQKAALARTTRTLSITIAAGLPLVDALSAIAGVTGNLIYKDAVLYVRDEAATGQKLHKAMGETKQFPNMVIQMVAIGEETGALEDMLTRLADIYEEEVDNAVEGLSNLLEPLIMVIIGAIIGIFVAAMYLPIFQLGSVI